MFLSFFSTHWFLDLLLAFILLTNRAIPHLLFRLVSFLRRISFHCRKNLSCEMTCYFLESEEKKKLYSSVKVHLPFYLKIRYYLVFLAEKKHLHSLFLIISPKWNGYLSDFLTMMLLLVFIHFQKIHRNSVYAQKKFNCGIKIFCTSCCKILWVNDSKCMWERKIVISFDVITVMDNSH